MKLQFLAVRIFYANAFPLFSTERNIYLYERRNLSYKLRMKSVRPRDK